ncbi:DUF1415 domain-containing protein [Vibrio sonorensis]|uniref:DUF1415 domain-containing protein n=1 Tax=Vibrio sonorensis TaxID=1004316 RepID=UPI0008D93AE3|nr:DUF1415 domain-containing protein [Vibrio sonorensis]
MSKVDNQTIYNEVHRWLKDVVIGLNLCPFAAKPERNKQIDIVISDATAEEALLEDILTELIRLEHSEPSELETTLVVVPEMLQDFMDYNFFIEWVEALIRQQNWEGVFQLATFHPEYCFADAHPDDSENLTNRSPYPVFHLIREESMEKVLRHYPDPESIPDNNIRMVESLTSEQRKKLFPYLF